MEKVMISVTQIFNTLVEVPKHLPVHMRADEALRLVGRAEGCKANMSTTVTEHKYDGGHKNGQ